MRIKPAIIVVSILLLIAVVINWRVENKTDLIDLPKNIIVQTKEKPIENPSTETTFTTIVKKTDKNTIIPTVFDDDPVVDIQLIISNNRFCYRLLSNIAQTKDYLEQIKMRVNNKQFTYFQNYTQYCEKLKLEHPEFQLTNKQRLLEQNKDKKATSLWGRIISGELDVDTLNNLEIQSLLKQNDANILSLAPKYLEKYYEKVIHWGLEDALQNHQYDYVTYIRYHAHHVYMCNIGADCGKNSSIMARICYQNSLSCGLTFQEYIKTVLTQGQQADIQLAMSYLRNIYQ